MNLEKDVYEQNGLKIDRNRVLTYSQLNCPLECRYCFVDDLNFNQKRKVAYLTQKQLGLLEKLPEEITLIMLGCDTEFFQSKQAALVILQKLLSLKKDVSVITKFGLSQNFLEKVEQIAGEFARNGNILAFSVSLPCMDSAKIWESGAPRPEKRIKTLQLAHLLGLKSLVAMRPLLPSVCNAELEEIICATKDFCIGYYSGPLYLKSLDLLTAEERVSFKIETIQPHWMPEGNAFYRVDRLGQAEELMRLLNKYGKPLFEGAAEGIEYLKRNL
jgi:DNA repair photolyase